MRRWGAFFVFGWFVSTPNPLPPARHVPAPSPRLEHHEHALWACLWCLARSRPLPSSRTPQTHPRGRICGVRPVPTPSPRLEHPKHALVGAFVVYGAFLLLPSSRTPKTFVGAFLVSDTSLPF